MSETKPSRAKTTRPQLSRVFLRKRLFAVLDGCFQGSSAWISGPPGSGKSTLVSSYLEGNKIQHLWYQLDKGDADVATFFHYLAQASLKLHGKGVRELPKPTPDYLEDLEAFSRRFFRAIYDCLTDRFAIVFDDYQVIPAQSSLHQIIRIAMNETPGRAISIVMSRSDPPRQMARLHANQRMTVVGWDELQLTPDEIKRIATLRDQKFPEETFKTLYERTNGWAAGVVLLLEQAKLQSSIATPPASSAPQVVFDYLAGETFERFEESTQKFLLSTACLPELTVEMATSISGHPKARRLLRNLTRNDYFVTERREELGSVYQFHPLFREFLMARARETLSDSSYAAMLNKAADLLEQCEQVESAVELRRELGQWDRIETIIKHHAADLVHQGRDETLYQWLDDLPRAYFRADPWLQYWAGVSRRHAAPREARQLFARAFHEFSAAPEQDTDGLCSSCCGIVNAILHEFDDLALLDPWIVRLDDLIGLLEPDSELCTRSTSTLLLARIVRQPTDSELLNDVEEFHRRFRQSSWEKSHLDLGPLAVIASILSGDFARAEDLIADFRVRAQSSESTSRAVGTLSFIESIYLTVTADHDASLGVVARGLEAMRSHGSQMWVNELLGIGIAGALAAGDVQNAERMLEEMAESTAGRRRLDRCLYHYMTAWAAALSGDELHAFHHQQTALRLALDVGAPLLETFCRLGLAQVAILCEDERKASAELRQVEELGTPERYPLIRFMANLAAAHCELQKSNAGGESSSLHAAMALGREYGFKHALWWLPESMSRLCALALDADIEPAYVCSLIRERGLLPDLASPRIEALPWPFRVYTFGGFRLIKGNDVPAGLDKGQGRPIELLKVLITLGARDVPSGQLTETLWSHVDSDDGYRSFTATLHRLRKSLGEDDAVILVDGRVSLNNRYFWLDTWALQDAFEEIDTAHRTTPARLNEDSVKHLTEGLLHLYAGDFLENESEHSCYATCREHFRTMFRRRLDKLAAH